MRIKRGVTARKRHKKVLRAAKGMGHARTSSFRLAQQGVVRSLQYSYRDRRKRKSDLRSLWIVRINAQVREAGLSYSSFMSALKTSNIELDRKVLSELAVNAPHVLQSLIKQTQKNK